VTPALLSTPLGPVEVAVHGSGSVALIAVHGMPGDWRQCRSVAEDHAGEATVVLPSRPGYGRTPLASGRGPDEQGDLWAGVLDSLGLQRAVVIGVSGGGPSAVSFAARHPDRCAGLLLCCAVALGVQPVPPAMRRLASVPGLWPLLTTVAGLRRQTPEHVAAGLLAGLTPTERDSAQPQALLRFAQESLSWTTGTAGTGLRNDVRQLAAAPSRAEQVRCPTTVLHGDSDTVVPLACAHHHASRIPGATLQVLPGFGHGLPLTARPQLAAATRALLREAG
jgi:pimeloyl-ACP methyl ester carboxylesterase